jgi:hypothetical protein
VQSGVTTRSIERLFLEDTNLLIYKFCAVQGLNKHGFTLKHMFKICAAFLLKTWTLQMLNNIVLQIEKYLKAVHFFMSIAYRFVPFREQPCTATGRPWQCRYNPLPVA